MITKLNVHGDSDDDARFIDLVISLARGMSEHDSPKYVYLVKIDNWFGLKWFKFSGVVLPTLGVGHDKPVRVPPFHPNRVVRERLFERYEPGWRERFDFEPLHVTQHSSDNLRRWLARVAVDCLFMWYSGRTKQNQRGSVMVHHIPHAIIKSNDAAEYDTPGFYFESQRTENAWHVGPIYGENRGVIERWCGATGDHTGA